jgi:hypothetical protein
MNSTMSNREENRRKNGNELIYEKSQFERKRPGSIVGEGTNASN